MKLSKQYTTVTPFSKCVALLLFIMLPLSFLYFGLWLQRQLDYSYIPLGQRLPANGNLPQISRAPEAPTLLIVSRPQDQIDNLPTFMVAVTDTKEVNTLYDDIFALPNSPHGPTNCPIDFFVRYTLDFYTNQTLILHGILDPSGCRGISFEHGQAKWLISAGNNNFLLDLQQALNLSNSEFFGSQNGRTN